MDMVVRRARSFAFITVACVGFAYVSYWFFKPKKNERKPAIARGEPRNDETVDNTGATFIHSKVRNLNFSVRSTGQQRDLAQSSLDGLPEAQRALSPDQGRGLNLLLHCSDPIILKRVLPTLTNWATVPKNQVVIRETGCLEPLKSLISHEDSSVQMAAITALGNLSLNEDNLKEMRVCIPTLFTILEDDPSNDLATQCLLTLSNMAVLSNCHEDFIPFVQQLYLIAANSAPQPRLQAIKLLVNLSCNELMIPNLDVNGLETMYPLLQCDDEDVQSRVNQFIKNITPKLRMH